MLCHILLYFMMSLFSYICFQDSILLYCCLFCLISFRYKFNYNFISLIFLENVVYKSDINCAFGRMKMDGSRLYLRVFCLINAILNYSFFEVCS